MQAFQAELRKLGHEEGRSVTFDVRWGENKPERLPSLATELVAHRPAVILTGSSGGVLAAKNATSTIPIVFASAASPVEQGFIKSFRQPGGNITGVMVHMTEAKAVEIVREILPRARRLAILIHKPDPYSKLSLEAFVAAAKRLKFEPLVIEVARTEELAIAFNEIVRQKADALYAPALVFIAAHRDYLVERALEARLPLLSPYEEMTAGGGLLSYGTERNENFRRAAVLVDKILRGASPAELPVEQPQKFELVVNLKTARTLGLKLPREFIQRADRVID
jgi:putative ABC transport system substrate-binding protein